jgi:RNA polymerase sigma-70 factor (ECF subfamily)
MGDVPTDADVIARVLEGDTEAFGTLVDRYQNEFAAYAKYMTGSEDEAADVIQESLVRAYKWLRRCNDRGKFKGWFFRIVSNQCKTRLTRWKRRPVESLAGAASYEAAQDDPHGNAEAADLRGRVYEALHELPTDQREALVLRYVDGLGVVEMAELLRVSVSAVKMRLLRGRAVLRERLRGIVP